MNETEQVEQIVEIVNTACRRNQCILGIGKWNLELESRRLLLKLGRLGYLVLQQNIGENELYGTKFTTENTIYPIDYIDLNKPVKTQEDIDKVLDFCKENSPFMSIMLRRIKRLGGRQ